MDSEDVFSALFSLLAPLGPSGTNVFKTVTRRLQVVEDVDSTYMPYVGQIQISKTPVNTMAGPMGYTYRAEWYIYTYEDDMQTPTSPNLNAAVEALLALFPAEGNALSFKVGTAQANIFIDGSVEWYEGVLDTKSVAKIPIQIMVQNNV